MKLNCQPGDIAEYVGKDWAAYKKYLGKRFVILSASTPDIDGRHFWLVHPLFDEACGECADVHLRPLRDRDGTDETLSWIDVPNEVTA